MKVTRFLVFCSLLAFIAEASSIEIEPNSQDRKSQFKNDDLTLAQWRRTVDLWNEFTKDKTDLLRDYYDLEVVFIDPFTRIEGLGGLINYYNNLYNNVESIRFEFGEKNIEPNQLFFTWAMYLKAKGLNKGKEIRLEGASLVKFSLKTNKVIYHRDYFDSGEFIYENVFFLKWIHSRVKKSLSATKK